MKLHVIEGTVHSWEGFMAKQAKAKKTPGPRRDQDKRDQDWIGILATITPQTRVIALVAMISEALFVAASFSIPDGQRLVAFLACAGLLIVAIGACVWLELSQRPTQEPITARVQLPNELAGNAFWIDPATQKDRSAVGDLYRTASNCKFAGSFEEAIRLYRKVLDVQPAHWKARYNIGSCLYYLGRLPEADRQFKRLSEDLKEIGVNSDPVIREILHGCYIQLNLICDKRRDFEAGRKYLHESLLVKPDDALSYLNLSISAIKSGSKHEGEKWYRVLLDHPEQLQVLSSLGPEDQRLIDSLEVQSEVLQ
jgi:tetratricopeptide (TPR) repeat protein